MVDFLLISTKSSKRDVIEIYPKFIVKRSSDLMIRGGDFYAVWLEDKGLWSTDEEDAKNLIDNELDKYAEENKDRFGDNRVRVLHLWDAESGMIDRWHKYCQKQMRDNFHMLDETIIFSNKKTVKEDYASKVLNYPLEEGDTPAYDKLMSVLYSPEERKKIEWAIGSIVNGDSKKLQKFLVLYGAAGTGKSTVLNIIQQLFDGYYSVFDAKALGSSNNSFALEPFKANPLVAIQHDGDLSHIEDNTRLNSLVSHELMTVNEKFKSAYANRFKCFLFMGTNKPVKITDAKSGLIRRLIDVKPTGDKLTAREYRQAVRQIDFELGAIAYHCLKVYEDNRDMYDDYIPTEMLGASNDFYNFIVDSYNIFTKDDGVTLKQAWELYKTYCEEAKVAYPFPKRQFKEELKNYFKEYDERTGSSNTYTGFKTEIFEGSEEEDHGETYKIEFGDNASVFDAEYSNCPAQLASSKDKPTAKWVDVTTKLKDIDTSKVHFVRLPENHIVIDFDIPDEHGNKSFEKNLEAASKWPPTYAELSKSGAGIHLHYIYPGDTSKLSSVFADHVEIKVFNGGSSLRRKLTKCNTLPIATISSGLPVKGEKMVNTETIKSERSLRNLLARNLHKEIHPGTKPSIDFIYKILDDAYNSNLKYDVSDMRSAVFEFACNSTHQSDYCMKLVGKMKFKSDEPSESVDDPNANLVFYDIEVFPNLLLVNWKPEGDGKPVVRMINPSPKEIEELIKFKLVGFNCRRYDNHILYARLLGYNNEQLYNLSKRIIDGDRNAFFGEAYNISYTDVYDFSSKKQSLKKFEIELGIHHQELGMPWDKPVPENMWNKVAEYCDNDVLATEATFNARKADWTARLILADVAGGTPNDTTNSLTTKIIFGNNRHPQDQFNYRDMGDMTDAKVATFMSMDDPNECYSCFDSKRRPVFPGYTYDHGKSIYRGEEVGEGGYVYAEPGIYTNIALLDIASMHPSSIVAETLFGDEYTERFREILETRIAIKHKEYERARTMLGGKLAKYLTDESAAADLAQALKIAINSVYGLTAANFDNPFRDVRNKDNIVAKRGALFMVNLKHEVQNRGFTVAHIKTDSIKIPNATPEIIQFVMDYGKLYGYNFEHEATYDRMCLVNDAVYIAKYKDGKHAGEWTATGTQFQVPYVFKKLFSHESIEFDDLCETKSVSKGDLYLDMNENLPDVSDMEKELSKASEKYRKGQMSDITYDEIKKELEPKIADGHNYIFVGRVGQFCPIKPGCKGGVLYRYADGKYYSATGTKGYRWLESELVKGLGKENDIDESYYIALADEARDTISKYGDFEMFVSDEPILDMNPPTEQIPFDED
jgi:energy-coupling factor transporter ATP-binding protein EcfA2